MTGHNTHERTDLQGSIKEQHRQGSLHPADPDMLTGTKSGKGYSQDRIDPAGQSSLLREQAVSSAQRSLSGKKERRQSGGVQRIIPLFITFVLGLLVAVFVFRIVYAPSQDANDSAASAGTEEQAVSDEEEAVMEAVEEARELEEAQEADTLSEEGFAEEENAEEEETVAADGSVEIPDPVLKKVLQDALGIGDREITVEDALSLTELEYNGYIGGLQIKDITGLSAFRNLTYLMLYENQISDISELSGLTNLTVLNLGYNKLSDISALSGLTKLKDLGVFGNPLSDISALSSLTNLTDLELAQNQIIDISALSNLTNLTYLSLSHNQISDISALSKLTELQYLSLYDNPVVENKSSEEIMEILSGAENLSVDL